MQLGDQEIELPTQQDVRVHGLRPAVPRDHRGSGQPTSCRTTAASRTIARRGHSAFGFDAGNAFSAAPSSIRIYDSILVKVTSWGRIYATRRRGRSGALQEFRIRGVKTNIPFLTQMIGNDVFLQGNATTRLIDSSPELFRLPVRRDRATRLLRFLADTIVNGNELVKDRPIATRRDPAPLPELPRQTEIPPGTRDRLKELGPVKFAQWVREQKSLLLTDTTMRDAHQSLLATRLRPMTSCRLPIPMRGVPRSSSRWRCGVGRRSIPRCDS
jgi:pyruvate carboxylase